VKAGECGDTMQCLYAGKCYAGLKGGRHGRVYACMRLYRAMCMPAVGSVGYRDCAELQPVSVHSATCGVHNHVGCTLPWPHAIPTSALLLLLCTTRERSNDPDPSCMHAMCGTYTCMSKATKWHSLRLPGMSWALQCNVYCQHIPVLQGGGRKGRPDHAAAPRS
jgi:hypothetical protein